MLSYGPTSQTAWKEVIGMKEEGRASVWAFLSDGMERSDWDEGGGVCFRMGLPLRLCMERSYWDEGGGLCFRMGLPLRLHGNKLLG